MPWLNAHTHDPPRATDEVALICLAPLAFGGMAAPHWGAAGVHPWHAADADTEAQLDALETALAAGRCVACGEIGLDRRCPVPLDRQRAVFLRQLAVADDRGLPVILHSVRAHADLLAIFSRRSRNATPVVHGFQGGAESARQLLDHGMMLSFGPDALRADARAAEVLRALPLERFFLETDDAAVPVVDMMIAAARLRGDSPHTINDAMLRNFARVFGTEAA
jgi:TatD DNase family protein